MSNKPGSVKKLNENKKAAGLKLENESFMRSINDRLREIENKFKSAKHSKKTNHVKSKLESYMKFLINVLGEEKTLLYLISERDEYFSLSPYNFIKLNPKKNISIEYDNVKSKLLGEAMGS